MQFCLHNIRIDSRSNCQTICQNSDPPTLLSPLPPVSVFSATNGSFAQLVNHPPLKQQAKSIQLGHRKRPLQPSAVQLSEQARALLCIRQKPIGFFTATRHQRIPGFSRMRWVRVDAFDQRRSHLTAIHIAKGDRRREPHRLPLVVQKCDQLVNWQLWRFQRSDNRDVAQRFVAHTATNRRATQVEIRPRASAGRWPPGLCGQAPAG